MTKKEKWEEQNLIELTLELLTKKWVVADINKVIPYEFNTKEHPEEQIDRIANSIKEFWFTQNIVTDENNIIIIWHWRFLAAKKLGLDKIPTIKIDYLDKNQVKKLRILDNKLNESEWILSNLKVELDEIKDTELTKLFEELDAPEFNPDEYIDWLWKEKEKKTYWFVEIKVTSEDQARILEDSIKEMWYENVKVEEKEI